MEYKDFGLAPDSRSYPSGPWRPFWLKVKCGSQLLKDRLLVLTPLQGLPLAVLQLPETDLRNVSWAGLMKVHRKPEAKLSPQGQPEQHLQSPFFRVDRAQFLVYSGVSNLDA
jgi:hypothetical protein